MPDTARLNTPTASLTDPPARRRWRRLGLLALAPLALVGVAILLLIDDRAAAASSTAAAQPAAGPARKKAGPAIPVLAARVITGDLAVYLTALGSVTPLNQVTVQSRVDGQLMKVHFTEGQLVRAGEPLADIDPRPYQVQVAQAEGALQRDAALLNNARADLARYRALADENGVSQQMLSTQDALVAQHEGALRSDQAQVDRARLDLAYAHISAPIGGRVGLRRVDPGNIVKASDTGGLVSITQVAPIAALFTIAQDHLPPVLNKLRAGQTLSVQAYDREQKLKLAEGRLLTVDNQIDPATGTLKCKAQFENLDGALFPNQFVNVRLLVDRRRGATLVPAAAVQRGAEQSTFVYVVAAAGAAEAAEVEVAIRPVRVGSADGGWVEVLDGLEPDEVVVLEGVDRLAAGSRVIAQLRELPPPAAS